MIAGDPVQVAAGIITQAEAALLASQRELAARVVHVDDFAQDLATSLLQPSDQPSVARPEPRPVGKQPARRAVA